MCMLENVISKKEHHIINAELIPLDLSLSLANVRAIASDFVLPLTFLVSFPLLYRKLPRSSPTMTVSFGMA